MKTPRHTSRHGSIVAIALIFAILLGLLLFTLLSFGLTEKRLNRHHATWAEARYGAESVLEYGLGEMYNRISDRSYLPSTTMLSSGTPLVLPPASFFAGSNIDTSSLLIVGGRFSDPTPFTVPDKPATDVLHGKTIKMSTAQVFARATAFDAGANERVTSWCSATIQIRFVPWLTGLANYLPDLEVAPGERMDCYGDFSTAGNLYVQSEEKKGLYFWRKVICAGTLYHYRKPGGNVGSAEGEVAIADGSGNSISMKQSGSWVTSATANFAQLALDLWDGNLLTAAHDVKVETVPGFEEYTPYDPAVPDSNPAHQLIEKPIANNAGAAYKEDIETQKFAVVAGLVISIPTTGAPTAYRYVKDPSGIYTRADNQGNRENYRREPVTLPTGLVTSTTMTDLRRSTTALKMWDVNVGKLRAAINGSVAADQIAGGFDKNVDWNGMVYVETANPTNVGVRVFNGAQIPDYGAQSGMSFATNAPLYVRGNYNADGVLPATTSDMGKPAANEPPAALIGDAITVLSNNWNDTKSSGALSSRTPTPTEISAAFIAGIVPTNKDGNARYSGGFENFPRFLENWSGVTFGYRGGVVVLFDSEVATQPWGGSNVYSAPRRLWAYNELFKDNTSKLPNPARKSNRVGFTEYRSQAEFDAAIAAAQAAP